MLQILYVTCDLQRSPSLQRLRTASQCVPVQVSRSAQWLNDHFVHFDRRNAGTYESMKCDIEKSSERWCELAGSLVAGGTLRSCITLLFSPSFFLLLLFLYCPLPLFGPAGCSSPFCLTVFAMNTFGESPLCGAWWMRTVENTLHSTLMLSPWPTLTAQCMSIFCILIGFESSPLSGWQVNVHPNKREALRTFS